MDTRPLFPQYDRRRMAKDLWSSLRLLLALERRMLAVIFSFSLGIGVFMLGVPIAVQELVSTFSFAVELRMVGLLALSVAGTLIGVAAFRVLQSRAVESLNQRVYTRVALGVTRALLHQRDDRLLPQHTYRVMEAEHLTRALVAMVADLLNVAVVGSIGMTMLVFYHPAFLLYEVALIGGFVALLVIFGQGGFLVTLEMSRLNYNVFHWIQNLAQNLPHLRAAGHAPYLLARTDELLVPYIMTRKARSNAMTGRQYKAAALWQVVGHSSLVAMAGYLVTAGQLTVGQFAAAEVIVGNLLLNMDTLARRMVALFFTLTSLRELAGYFSLPHEERLAVRTVRFSPLNGHRIHVTCRNVSFAYPDSPPLLQGVDLDIPPGEKVAVLCQGSLHKTALARILAGLSVPSAGVVRYNDANLADVSLDSLITVRGIVLDSLPTLLDGTIEDNITLGRPSIAYHDIQWALRFAELTDEVDALPAGLRTRVTGHGKAFTLSQILRIHVARAIVVRPQLLIFDGTLHSMQPVTREIILRRLCSKDEPWSAVFVSNDPSIVTFTDRTIMLE